jgi:hypothetical protein
VTVAFYGILASLAAVQDSPVVPVTDSSLTRPAYEEEQADEASRVVIFDVLERTGKCLVNVDPKASMALLTTVPGTQASDRAFDKLHRHLPDCLGIGVERTKFYGTIEVQMKGTALKGAVAQALYRLQFASRPPSSLPIPASVAPIMPPASDEIYRQLDEKYRQLIASYAFAQCLVYAQPEAVRRLVLSKIASSEESEALSQLRQFMRPCVYKGTTVKADRNSFRLMLAQSLYRWSITAAASSAARP